MSRASSRGGRISARQEREWKAASTPVPQSARSGHEIPGYTGHIPAVVPENVYGKTFRQQNSFAAQGRGGRECFPPSIKRTASAPANVVPGYMGHVPGTSENVFAKGWKDTKVHMLSALEPDGFRHPPYGVSSKLVDPPEKLQKGRAGSEIPGYSGYIAGVRPEPLVMGGTARNINDKVHSARGLDPTHRPSHFVPLNGPRPPRRRAHKEPERVIPGYMGHVPGSSENVHGKINLEATHEKYETLGISAKHNFTKAMDYDPRTPRSPPLPREVDDHHTAVMQAISLPGYSGHVPGKVANNVMGRTFRAANIKATKEKFHGRRGYDTYHPIQGRHYYGASDAGSVVSGRSCASGMSEGKDWVSLASSGISLPRGRTAPGELLRQPSLESLQSSSSMSSAVSSRSGTRGGRPRSRASSAPPRRSPPPSDDGKTMMPASGTLKMPMSARSTSTRASMRSSSLSR